MDRLGNLALHATAIADGKIKDRAENNHREENGEERQEVIEIVHLPRDGGGLIGLDGNSLKHDYASLRSCQTLVPINAPTSSSVASAAKRITFMMATPYLPVVGS